jgi:SAM-dependent methyltransferase
MVSAPPDAAKVEAFNAKVIGELTGAYVTLLGILGDRLGLFRELAKRGPVTSSELAGRLNLNERYVREWLGGMACADYLEYDPKRRRFRLPPEHAMTLAEEGGPYFLAGAYQELAGETRQVDRIGEAFRHGGGVPPAAFDPDEWLGIERQTATAFRNLLVQQWIPAVPEVQAKLEHGASVADVGCGSGRAIIQFAQAFPRSRYVGYDAFRPSVETARANARAAGVSDRVSFETLDVALGLPEQYDVITTFDVVHDSVAPLQLLRAIRTALKRGGRYLMLEVNCADRLEENLGPMGALFHGWSVFYCLTTSLAQGGEGLGTLGMPEPKVRSLCAEAGFGPVRRVPLDHPVHALYEVRAA